MFTQSFESKPSASPGPQMCFSFMEISSAIMYWGREGDTELLVQILDLFESLPYAYTFSEKCGQNTLEKWFLRWLFVGSVYIVLFDPNIKYNRQCNNTRISRN